MDRAQRLERDEQALKRLLKGEPWEQVAARNSMTRVQLWRRVGKRLKAMRQQGERHE